MVPTEPLVDIHCHVIPGIDDGAKSWSESLAMARMAVDDGIGTIIATPHQLGAFSHNCGAQIRKAADELQVFFTRSGIALTVLPGADVRITADLCAQLERGDVLTLGDRGTHVLLELPHEIYFSIDACLDELAAAGITGILSHPERNLGLLREPNVIGQLVKRGCLMQVTAGSLTGAFGPRCQSLAELMLENGWLHFLATDAHGSKARRPLMRCAYGRIAELTSEDTARLVCCRNPSNVASGKPVSVEVPTSKRRTTGWFGWRRAA